MTVTPEQWAAAAAGAGMTIAELHAKIAEIDNGVEHRFSSRRLCSWSRSAPDTTGPPLHFDRQGDPLTTGEWAVLYEWARSYRFLAETILPNRYWIATIWTGTDENGDDDPPVVMQSSVFLLNPNRDGLPASRFRIMHLTEEDAFEAHAWLVRLYSQADPPTRQQLAQRTGLRVRAFISGSAPHQRN